MILKFVEQEEEEEDDDEDEEFTYDSRIPSFQNKDLSIEEVAAIKIQACFRGHLVLYLTMTYLFFEFLMNLSMLK